MKVSDSKILNFHKLHKVNPGIVVFIFIFLYVLVCIILGSKETSIVGYQVKNGTLSENRIYTGIALRDENVVYSPATGYIALFIEEGTRTAYNNLVYAIDQNGKISDLTTKDPNKEIGLEAKDISSLRQDIMLFSKDFTPSLYEDVVLFENNIHDKMSRLENRELLANVDEINSQHINDIISYYKANNTGIVSYYLDGYENSTAEQLTPDDFKNDTYEPSYVYTDDMINTGDFIYKFVNNENWSLCIYVSNEELSRIEEDDYIDVLFSKTKTHSWGHVHIVNRFDDGAIISLSFTNSMVTFAKDRFVEIELLVEEDTGLKVPNSSIAENTFFLIDKDFVVQGVNGANYGVNKQVISDSGNVTTKFSEIIVYKETDEEYYVSTTGLNIGDVIYYVETDNSPGTHDLTYVVGKQGTLIGVYNINKGYADFKQIEVLYSNDEYSIIKANSPTGLRAYDYIALDASVVTDKDFVY